MHKPLRRPLTLKGLNLLCPNPAGLPSTNITTPLLMTINNLSIYFKNKEEGGRGVISAARAQEGILCESGDNSTM